MKRVGVIRSGAAQVRVNLRTGAIYSRQPEIRFEGKPVAAHFSLEDSVWKIEMAMSTGEMRPTQDARRGLSRLREVLTEEDRGLNFWSAKETPTSFA